MVEIFVEVIKELEIFDVGFVLLIFIELEIITCEESLKAETVIFVSMLDQIVSLEVWLLVSVIL